MKDLNKSEVIKRVIERVYRATKDEEHLADVFIFLHTRFNELTQNTHSEKELEDELFKKALLAWQELRKHEYLNDADDISKIHMREIDDADNEDESSVSLTGLDEPSQYHSYSLNRLFATERRREMKKNAEEDFEYAFEQLIQKSDYQAKKLVIKHILHEYLAYGKPNEELWKFFLYITGVPLERLFSPEEIPSIRYRFSLWKKLLKKGINEKTLKKMEEDTKELKKLAEGEILAHELYTPFQGENSDSAPFGEDALEVRKHAKKFMRKKWGEMKVDLRRFDWPVYVMYMKALELNVKAFGYLIATGKIKFPEISDELVKRRLQLWFPHSEK